MLLCPAIMAPAQVSIGISLPGLSIGINQPVYPNLVPVPGYPVYYAPNSASNYFFYDGLYWVYQDNEWYSSEWYNGPWSGIQPNDVPVFLLRVPVRYYRRPPTYFGGWDRNAPPRWGEHWGHEWEQRRGGWDRWDRHAVPRPAPLPTYQRRYSGARYPHPEQQQELHGRNYRYQPKEPVVRAQYQQRREQGPGGHAGPGEPQRKGLRPEAAPHQQPAPAPRPGNPPPLPGSRPNNPMPPAQPPQPTPRPRPNNPMPPAQHPQPAPAPRPNTPGPPAQHPQPAPGARLGSPGPAQTERPQQQKHEAARPNAHQGPGKDSGGKKGPHEPD
jgi:hypothetical protein